MASAAGPQNTGNVNYFFQIIVFLCITFLFGKLDPIAPLTLFGMNTIGVFLGVIYAWVFIDIIWPSMVGLARAHAARRPARNGAAQQGLRRSHSHHDDVHLRVQRHPRSLRPGEVYLALFVSRKCVQGETVRLTFALLLAIAILGGLTSATPAGRHRAGAFCTAYSTSVATKKATATPL